MKKSAVILIVVVTLAIVVGIAAALIPVFASPVIVTDYNQLDLEYPSTTTTPVPINDNTQQEELQKLATDKYETMKNTMLNFPELFKKSDFCSELIISQEIYRGQTRTFLTAKTGFYIGPVLLFDGNGNEVYRSSVLLLTPKSGQQTIPNEFKDCTIVTLDKINPEFARNYPYFLPE